MDRPRYDKERVIGSGSFGNVWLVKSRYSRHTYVLKEIDLKALKEEDRQHCRNEVNILSKCQHIHIIRYKEAVVESDILSIIMEYAEGGDLHATILKQRGVPFSEHRIITWFLQICLALQYLHHRNILHRDLKSANIFLTRNKVIKVGDLGIARVLQNPGELVKTAIGTPYYLSPEICQRKPYNHKSDIWALGCILFEMAALELPFQATDLFRLACVILKGKRKELPRHCSPLIKDLIEDLLNLDPDRRPCTKDIMDSPPLQPYLSEYFMTQGSRESFLPVLISPKMRPRGNSISDFLKNIPGQRKRRSFSASEIKQNIPKVVIDSPKTSKGTSQEKNLGWKNFRSSFRRQPTNIAKFKLEKKQEGPYSPSNSKVAYRHNKKEKPVLTASCDAFLAEGSHSKNYLSKYEDPVLDNTDCGYQSCNTNLGPSDGSNKENKAGIQSQYKTRPKHIDQAFHANASAKDSPTSLSGAHSEHHNNCQHAQCHQCMLDTLWKNRIRCNDEGLVDKDNYSILRNKLFLLYKKDLFQKIYQSLLLDWEGNENGPSSSLLSMMQSLNFEQVQSLPLMMQLVQLDLFLKLKQSGENTGENTY